MDIVKDKFLNVDSYVLKSEKIELVVLPDIGFKIASIKYLPKNKEFLDIENVKSYKKPKYNDLFKDYDNSGGNDMIPTLEPCEYPEGSNFEDVILPDRGDAWSLDWDVKIENNRLIGELYLKSLPLKFIKIYEFIDESTINMEYMVENLTDKDMYYLWSFQAFNKYEEDLEFIFNKGMSIPVNTLTNEDLMRYDLKNLNEYRDDRAYKYFFWGKREDGIVGIDYKNDKIKYTYEYDVEKVPYLGVYVDKQIGRFSIEPTNSFFDSIIVAYDNNSCHIIEGNKTDKWNVKIRIEEY